MQPAGPQRRQVREASHSFLRCLTQLGSARIYTQTHLWSLDQRTQIGWS